MFFRRPRITADYEVDEAASGAGSPILSKTCRGHIALDEMLFDQYFVSALSFQQVICIGTCPHGAFRSHDSCPWRKGQPQAPYQAEFSVRIAHLSPEGTATNTISSGFLCSNCSSEPGRDSHKHHIKRISLFERAIGDRFYGPPG